jgi:hypothetical protein
MPICASQENKNKRLKQGNCMRTNIYRFQPRLALLALAFCATGSPLVVHSQAIAQPPSASSQKRWANAANRWQHTAVDLAKQTDTVTPEVRAQRNAKWQGLQGLMLNSSNLVFSFSGDAPELPKDPPNEPSIWVIATFEKFHVYAVGPDEKQFYTEMNFRIKTLFREPEGMHLVPGDLVDVNLWGGMAKTHSGKIVRSLNVNPRTYDFQLGHKYLVNLFPDKDGDFVAAGRWDLTSGTVQAQGPDEIDRAARGESKLSGMTETELIKYLQTALSTDPQE